MKPYAYIATSTSRDLTRNMPEGGRIAVHFPDLGHAVELHVDPRGGFAVTVGPSAGESGEWTQLLSHDFDGSDLVGMRED
jgi:hypothetical protein